MANCPSIGANVNATSLAVALGCEADVNTRWFYLQPNDISSYAAVLARVAREPISLDRQRQKGSVTDLTTEPAFPQDTTMDGLAFFAPVMLFTNWKGPSAGAFGYEVSAVSATEYTVNTTTALAAGTLVIARGFMETANNGLKVVDAGATATTVPVIGGLTVETPGTGYSLHECGFRGATGDIAMNANGDLTSTVLDFTTLPLFVGAYVNVQGFATAASNGFARVTAIETNRLALDNHRETPAADTGTGVEIDIYYGSWCRNVPVTDSDFNVNNMMLEVGYDLPAGRAYEYADQATMNTVALSLPLTDKSTLDFATVAKDIGEATETRRPGTWVNFVANELFNTADDLGRLRLKDIDGAGVTTYFTEATVNVNNNVSAKKVLGQLGAADINYGRLDIGQSMTTLFTDTNVTTALRNNVTCSLELMLVNNDGAAVIDQPEITLGGGEKSFPVNDKVSLDLENEAFGSVRFGYTQSVTLFRYVP